MTAQNINTAPFREPPMSWKEKGLLGAAMPVVVGVSDAVGRTVGENNHLQNLAIHLMLNVPNALPSGIAGAAVGMALDTGREIMSELAAIENERPPFGRPLFGFTMALGLLGGVAGLWQPWLKPNPPLNFQHMTAVRPVSTQHPASGVPLKLN